MLFDLGSQTTLVRDKFAEQAGWSYSRADYSLAGIGTSATTIRGRRWNFSLIDSCGKVHVVKGYRVPDILQENWSFPSIMNLAFRFPNIPKSVFQAQGNRPLDILIGKDALKLIA